MESAEPCCSKTNDQGVEKMNEIGFTDLPFDVKRKIIGILSFADISKIRLVSKDFHRVCADLLNGEFIHLKKIVFDRLEDLKSQMPKRSSIRRKHPLFEESELLEAVHLRLNVVNVKMSKHLERREICFYPGAILDEINLIISGQRKNHPSPTEELFDLCSMACEHFTDEIKPLLPKVSTLEFMDTSVNLFAVDPTADASQEDCCEDEYFSEDTCAPKETDENSMQTAQEVIDEPALKELKISIKKVTKDVKKTSKTIKAMKFQVKTLNKNVNKLKKMVCTIKNQHNKRNDVDKEKSLNDCFIKLNQCNQLMESFESHLINCEESESILMQINEITPTEKKIAEELNGKEYCPIKYQNKKAFTETMSSIPSSSLPSTSQSMIPITDSWKESESLLMQIKEMTPTEIKIADEIYEIEHYAIKSQNKNTFTETMSSFILPSLPSTSQPMIPIAESSLKRKYEGTSEIVLPEEKKMKFSD